MAPVAPSAARRPRGARAGGHGTAPGGAPSSHVADAGARPAVQLFVTCMVDLFRPAAGTAAVRVIERRGVTVEFPMGQTCCGQFAHNAGYRREAAAMGRQLVRAFQPVGDRGSSGVRGARRAADSEPAAPWSLAGVPVVALSGSCAAMVAHQVPALLEADAVERGWGPESAARWRARAEILAERVVELSAWLDRADAAPPSADSEPGAAAAPTCAAGSERGADAGGSGGGAVAVTRPAAPVDPLPVACHTGCHMRRLLHDTEAPMRVLRSAGTAPEEPPDADQCCGFGGTFALREPELSAAMADAKLEALKALREAGAAGLVGTDLGCLMQLGGRLQRRGDSFPVLHLAELVDAADRGALTHDGLERVARAAGDAR